MSLFDIFLFTINSILPVVLLILLGYFLKRKGFFSKDFLKTANKTVFYVCLPVLLFKNISDIDSVSEIRVDVVFYCVLILCLLFLIGWLMTLLLPDPRQKGVVHQCVFRSNFALIGLPFAELIGGSDGMKVAAILSMFSIPIFNIFGVIVLSVYRQGSVSIDWKKIGKDILKNPLIIGVFLGLVFLLIKEFFSDSVLFRAGDRISFLSTGISYLSRAATPLSLLVLGGQFEFSRIKGYKKQLFMGLLGRNVIAPLLGVSGAVLLTKAGLLSFGPDAMAGIIALFGTPVAVSSAIMAEAMDNDGQLAGQLVVWTSLLSVASLFAVIFLVKYLGLL